MQGDPFSSSSRDIGSQERNGNPLSQAGSHEPSPPPYESVVFQGDGGAPAPSDFDIFVTDPVKQGDGVGAYVSYKVITKTSMQQYRRPESEVIRRYRDFAWLHQRLQEQNRGIIIPPIPEKNAVQKFQLTSDFIEQRRRALTVFINRVAMHPALKNSKDLQLFLEGSEEEWAAEVSHASYEASGTKKKIAQTLQLFKDFGHSTANLVSGKTDDEEEDPEYLKVREYVEQLEMHLTEAHRQATRLIKRQSELGQSLAEFGTSMVALGKFEQEGLASSFQVLGGKAEQLARYSQEHATRLSFQFEAPLKEFVRTVKSARAVMVDRSQALTALQQARVDVDAKRTKLAKLRGTPGIKEEKVAEVERELNEAQRKVELAKDIYENIVHNMSQELARFQRERAAEMALTLRDFAVAEAQLSSDTAKVWSTLVPADANGTS